MEADKVHTAGLKDRQESLKHTHFIKHMDPEESGVQTNKYITLTPMANTEDVAPLLLLQVVLSAACVFTLLQKSSL